MRGETKKVACKGCGGTFETPSHENRHFCNFTCYQRWRRNIIAHKPKIFYCLDCKKEIPRDSVLLNEGRCFICWFKFKKFKGVVD